MRPKPRKARARPRTWSEGCKTLPDNLQMLCAKCNQSKGGALL